MNDIPPSGWGALGAGLMGAVGVWMHFRKQANTDKTDRVEERVKRDQYERLEAENVRLATRLEQALRDPPQRHGDAILIASLEAERNLLMRDIRRMVRKLPPEVVDTLESNFSALADVEERIEPRR